jgi:hypothetical protein
MGKKEHQKWRVKATVRFFKKKEKEMESED